jgi:hypothetical protein
MAEKIKTITHTAPMGQTIDYQFRNMFGILFICMHTNFDPIVHIHFASAYIANILGIRGINSVEVNRNGGSYYFGLIKDYDPALISKSIENDFFTYFKTIDKNPIV